HADEVALVGLVAVLVGRVLLAEHRHRADAELRARPEHADRDLAAVRAEHLLEGTRSHGTRTLRWPSRQATPRVRIVRSSRRRARATARPADPGGARASGRPRAPFCVQRANAYARRPHEPL